MKSGGAGHKRRDVKKGGKSNGPSESRKSSYKLQGETKKEKFCWKWRPGRAGVGEKLIKRRGGGEKGKWTIRKSP